MLRFRWRLGYLSPENCDDLDVACEYNPTPSFECDDLDVACEYNPTPSFEFLKNAYTKSNISCTIMME
jgi:hypothetical protein